MTPLVPRAARVLASPSVPGSPDFTVAPSGRCWQSPCIGVPAGIIFDAPVSVGPAILARRPPSSSGAPACPVSP